MPGYKSSFRHGLAVAGGIAVLVSAELLLRLLGMAAPIPPAKNLLADRLPLFRLENGVFRTAEPARIFFLDQEFPAEKRPSTIRILLAGGSTAMGFPVESVFGLKPLLSVALPQVAPGYSYEVINVGGFGLASPEVLEVLVECLGYEPDAVVVMTGHNEFLRRRFGTTEDEESRVKKIFSRVRLYRLLCSLVSVVSRRGEDLQWRPHRVTTEERELVLADFERNLARIVRMCQRNSVPLVLVTCPSNLIDYRPYGPSAVPQKAQEEIDRRLGTDPEAALRLIEKWENKAPDDAWLKYEAAWVWWSKAEGLAGERKEAEEARKRAIDLWNQARDLDSWPVRASSAVNRIIREVGQKMKVPVADVEAEFIRVSAAEGLPGNALFFDHCHPNRFGQRLLAQVVIRALGVAGIIRLNQDWESGLWIWDQQAGTVSPQAWAECYYRIAYETGANMDRPARGLDYLRQALQLNPSHEKARKLLSRLETATKERYILKGE